MKGSAHALRRRSRLTPALSLYAAIAVLPLLGIGSAVAIEYGAPRPRSKPPHYRPFDPGLRCQTATQACWLATTQQIGRQCTCDKPGTKRGYGRVIR
ncbi:MAG: hypothetical protein JWM36_3282 [Hyphomicrobiales bacterium]|nr:hypothetical protein [Hyphomicrobiales bacterium]